MKIFVVIVTFNGSKWTQKCFDSLKNSSIPLNIIVIDNGSSDGTQSIIQQLYSEVDFIQSKENIGFGAANNLGIKKAYDQGADYVFLLNQDAWIEKDTIKSIVSAAQKHPEFYIISPLHLNGKGDALDYNFSNYIAPNKCKNLYSDYILKNKKKDIYELPRVNAAAWLIRRECIETIGGFNPSFFHYGEDDNYCLRVIYHGFKVGVAPVARIFHDREQRTENIYFDNKFKVTKRKFIFELSNPVSNLSLKRYRIKLYQDLLKCLILFNYKCAKSKIVLIKAWSILDKNSIMKNRATSQKKGLNFL